jgi:ankyrin repeat protein
MTNTKIIWQDGIVRHKRHRERSPGILTTRNATAKQPRHGAISTQQGSIPLHFAISKGPGSEAIPDAVLEAGADVNIPSQSTLYPVDTVVRDGHAGAIRKLVEHSANPNPVDVATMDSPLYHAIEVGSVESVAALLDSGVKYDIVFKDGWTPMIRSQARRPRNWQTTLYEREEHHEDGYRRTGSFTCRRNTREPSILQMAHGKGR